MSGPAVSQRRRVHASYAPRRRGSKRELPPASRESATGGNVAWNAWGGFPTAILRLSNKSGKTRADPDEWAVRRGRAHFQVVTWSDSMESPGKRMSTAA